MSYQLRCIIELRSTEIKNGVVKMIYRPKTTIIQLNRGNDLFSSDFNDNILAQNTVFF